MKIKFNCPACDYDRMEEILSDVTQASVIVEVEPDCAEYGEHSTDGGVIDRFQCVGCGWPILDDLNSEITTYEELYKWLESNDMLIEE